MNNIWILVLASFYVTGPGETGHEHRANIAAYYSQSECMSRVFREKYANVMKLGRLEVLECEQLRVER